ncbi:immunity 8 family protein [Actimicrobium antarcticum]
MAIVKGIWIDSATISLETYSPNDRECFGLWINLRVGQNEEEGSHDYQLLVCTPDWLKKEYFFKKAVWGRHMLIVFEYDLDVIKNEIYRCIESCVGTDWPTITQKVAKFAAWEFEDYQRTT